MVIKKKKETFNDYSVEMSWGQLNAIYAALEQKHDDPLTDELYAELGWYLQNVPGPGEDEEEYKQARDAEKQALEGGEGGEGGAPGADAEQLGQEVGPEGPEGTAPPAGPEQPPEDETASEADQFLERPPGGGGGAPGEQEPEMAPA